ncbi:MAG: hypothetical protein EKK47_03165 [Burkholderiales bacterium]|nr:MAG: hypothetical protein EKK47_03165 [Burkholderiales bacterium]
MRLGKVMSLGHQKVAQTSQEDVMHRSTTNKALTWGAGLLAALVAHPSWAWGPQGHETVATIASQLIKGTPAEAQVKAIVGDWTLSDISVWPDCAKGIDPTKDYQYQHPGKYAECKLFETPQSEAEMSDFVRRNDTNCQPKPGEESCHKQYHYSDISIQHSAYSLGPVGTRNDDIVAAVAAATHVLKGDPSPAPFAIKDKREALLLIVHYVGDLHQPLHVGAIYLNAKGKRVDPDKGTFSPATDTRGGNNITVNGGNLHAKWDAVPSNLASSNVDANWISQAQAVAPTDGDVYTWPASWASGTLAQASTAYKNVKFGALKQGHWPATLPKNYDTTANAIKKKQLTLAGARLAELLKAIWP